MTSFSRGRRGVGRGGAFLDRIARSIICKGALSYEVDELWTETLSESVALYA